MVGNKLVLETKIKNLLIGERFITQRVYDKSLELLSNLDPMYFKIKHDCYATQYHTLIIDFYDDLKNEFSLEIGYKGLGYFTDGKFMKIVELLNIESKDNINLAVKEIKNDLQKLFIDEK